MPNPSRSILTSAGIVRAVSVFGGRRPLAARFLLALARAEPDEHGWRRLSTAAAARAIGTNRGNVCRVIRDLKAAGALEHRRAAGSGAGGTSSYRVVGLVWRWKWPRPESGPMFAVPAEDLARALSLAGEIVRSGESDALVTPSSNGAVGASQLGRTNGKNGARRPSIGASQLGRTNSRRCVIDRRPKTPLVRPSNDAPIANSLLAPSVLTDDATEPKPERTNRVDDAERRAVAEWTASVAQVIYRTSGRPVHGRLRTRLEALATRLSVADAARIVTSAHDGEKPPGLVSILEHEVADAGASPAAPAPAAAVWLMFTFDDANGRHVAEPRRFDDAAAAAAAAAAADDNPADWIPAGASNLEVEPMA